MTWIAVVVICCGVIGMWHLHLGMDAKVKEAQQVLANAKELHAETELLLARIQRLARQPSSDLPPLVEPTPTPLRGH